MKSVKERVVSILEKNPQTVFATAAIAEKAGVTWPISGLLTELADGKLIRRVGHGKYRSVHTATNGVTRPAKNGVASNAPAMLAGEIRKQAVLTSEQDDVVLKVDGNEFRIKWPKFVNVFISNCDPA